MLSVKQGLYFLNKITGKEELKTPIFFLFIFSLMLGVEMGFLNKNLNSHGSIILFDPILFAENILGTIANFCVFFLPVYFFVIAFRQRDVLLKCSYLLGAFPLLLTAPIINKIGFKSLYFIKIAAIFAVIMCLLKYLFKSIELYQLALKQELKADNKANEADVKKPSGLP